MGHRKKAGFDRSNAAQVKLPKFYFLRTSDDPEEFEVNGRTAAFNGDFRVPWTMPLLYLAPHPSNSVQRIMESSCCAVGCFDDIEIEYDEITDANEEDIKLFFQRLQQGLPLTSSEKLNAVHSKLRTFCRALAHHPFFKDKVAFSDKRYAYFDVAAKVAAIEIEGIDTSLRYDALKELLEKLDRTSQSDRRLLVDYRPRSTTSTRPFRKKFAASEPNDRSVLSKLSRSHCSYRTRLQFGIQVQVFCRTLHGGFLEAGRAGPRCY